MLKLKRTANPSCNINSNMKQYHKTITNSLGAREGLGQLLEDQTNLMFSSQFRYAE